jgi:hypothetical protein
MKLGINIVPFERLTCKGGMALILGPYARGK